MLKDEATSVYELRYFGLEADSRSVSCMDGWYYEAPLGVINDYRGMANFEINVMWLLPAETSFIIINTDGILMEMWNIEEFDAIR